MTYHPGLSKPLTLIILKVPCTGGCCDDEQYYVCERCYRICPYCNGQDDEYFEWCDDCYYSMTHKQENTA